MWRILKTEIDYNIPIFINIFIAACTGFILLHFWPRLFGHVPNLNTGFISISYMYFYFVGLMVSLPWTKERRVRYLVLLPCPIRHITVANLAVFILYWMAIVALYVIFAVFSRHFLLDSVTVIALLSQTGIVFIAYCCLKMMDTLHGIYWKKTIEVSSLFLFALLSTAGVVHGYQERQDADFIARFLSWIYKSPQGAIFSIGLSIFLIIILIFLIHRKSYVEG